MIVIIAGGIGSGKTLSIVKDIVDRQQKTFTNFSIFGKPYTRLKYEHMFEKVSDGKKTTFKLNYDYWNKEAKKQGGFDIYLDEFHNLMSSRRAMSKKNVLLSDWLSQIRKILGQSELNNLVLITQKCRRIDVNSRDLAHYAIMCNKVQYNDIMIPTEIREKGKIITKKLPLTMIYKNFFADAESLMNYESYGIGRPITRTRFVGNPYYKYFDSYELIDFGSEEYV